MNRMDSHFHGNDRWGNGNDRKDKKGEQVDAAWELLHHKHKIGISETANFKTNKVNLWGWKHVISPELFIPIFIQPGESTEWSRTYKVFNIN